MRRGIKPRSYVLMTHALPTELCRNILMVFRASGNFHAWLFPLLPHRPYGERTINPLPLSRLLTNIGKRPGNRKFTSPFQPATRECGIPRRFLTPNSSYMPFGVSLDQFYYMQKFAIRKGFCEKFCSALNPLRFFGCGGIKERENVVSGQR